MVTKMSTTLSERARMNSRVSAKTTAIRFCAGLHNEGERTKCLSLKCVCADIFSTDLPQAWDEDSQTEDQEEEKIKRVYRGPQHPLDPGLDPTKK